MATMASEDGRGPDSDDAVFLFFRKILYSEKRPGVDIFFAVKMEMSVVAETPSRNSSKDPFDPLCRTIRHIWTRPYGIGEWMKFKKASVSFGEQSASES